MPGKVLGRVLPGRFMLGRLSAGNVEGRFAEPMPEPEPGRFPEAIPEEPDPGRVLGNVDGL
jgi:hypothetical protein